MVWNATANSISNHLPNSSKMKFLRSPARGGSTTAKISSFTALLITDERLSSALPTKKLQFVTPLFSALLLASLTACTNSSSPKTWPHFWKTDTIMHLHSYYTNIYTHLPIYICTVCTQTSHAHKYRHISLKEKRMCRWSVLICICRKAMGFGGLEVACWPLVPKFAGSNLAEAVGFLGRKNPQHAFLQRGSKAVSPMS